MTSTAAAWLLKTEPSSYSFADLARDGRARWDGVANPVALANLRRARLGDPCVLYHTGKEKAAVGTATIARAAYRHPDDAGDWVVDLEAGAALARPVTLAELKADPAFAACPLVRQGRLSFVPLTREEHARLLALAASR